MEIKIKWTREFKRLYGQFHRYFYYQENKKTVNKGNAKRNKVKYKYKYQTQYYNRNKLAVDMYTQFNKERTIKCKTMNKTYNYKPT